MKYEGWENSWLARSKLVNEVIQTPLLDIVVERKTQRLTSL
jgi:hypothetical protein